MGADVRLSISATRRQLAKLDARRTGSGFDGGYKAFRVAVPGAMSLVAGRKTLPVPPREAVRLDRARLGMPCGCRRVSGSVHLRTELDRHRQSILPSNRFGC